MPKRSLAAVMTAAFVLILGIVAAGCGSDDEGGGGGGEGNGDFFRADDAWVLVVILTVGYMLSRGWAKSGAREFHWDDPEGGGMMSRMRETVTGGGGGGAGGGGDVR